MQLLNPNSSEPLYKQLTTQLINQIKSDKHMTGKKLPSVRELAKMYQVSGITVRRALDVLRQSEYVYSVQGKGYFVANRVIRKCMPTREGFSENIEREGLTPSSIVLRAELQRAGSQMGRQFGINPSSEVVFLERVRLADGVPLCIQVCYLPHYISPGILEYDFSQLSLYRVLREVYHVIIGKSFYTIKAALAGDKEVRHLNLTSPAAVLWFHHWTYTPSGKLFEDGNTAYRADRYQISSTMGEFELIPESGS